ncbi:alanine--tRNA ligase, partial [Candidatus Acetothermia bacterium]
VLSDIPLKIQEMTLEEAKAYGAIAHFEEEYRGKEKVRVVEVPGVSKELCGGTHVRRTGEIGPIVILAEEAVAAGTRRIRALVGERARSYLSAIRDERRKLARLLKVPEGEVVQVVERLAAEAAGLRKELAAREEQLSALRARELAVRAEEVAGVRLLGAVVEGGPEAAKRLADLLAERLGNCVVILGTRAGDRGVVVVKATDKRLHAGELVREAAGVLGGKGGGRPTFAQGGGPDAEALPQAIEAALRVSREKVRTT